MNIYYVYFYLRSDYTPYYVGKGKNKRAFQKHKHISIPKDKSKIIIVESDLTELQAFILERYYIRWFGRKDNETGILRNLTDGGEGSSGKIISDLTKMKLSNSNKGKIPWNSGEKMSLKFCQKVSESKLLKNKKLTDKEKLNISISTKKAMKSQEIKDKCSLPHIKKWKIISPNNEEYIIFNLSEFCRKMNLNRGNMVQVSKGRHLHHKNWRCKCLDN